MKEVMQGNVEVELDDELALMDEAESKTSSDDIEDNVLRSIEQKDEKSKEKGQLLNEALNQGLSAFNPDIMFQNLTKNYSMARKIYGETLIRLISGYNPEYIKRNIRIPEFKRELKKKLNDNVEALKDEKLVKRDRTISEEGLKLASIVMFSEELDNIIPKGSFGEKIHKKVSHYGERAGTRAYRKGDRYKDIEIKQSLKTAIRRGHKRIIEEDLRTSERESKGQAYIVYAIDASGSMKGKKIEMCKKAGIALAYKAITAKDKVGLIVFGSEVKEEVYPTDDFPFILQEITKVKASKQTDFKGMLHKALEMFPSGDITKHLIVLTDAMPTVGRDPIKDSLKEIAKIKNSGITVSLMGINLDSEAANFASKFVQIGEGRLYLVREPENMDKLVLEDYYSVSS